MRSTMRRRQLAVLQRRDRRQAAGVDADADRDAPLLGFLDDGLHLVDVADVARVEAQAVEAGADRRQGPAVVEVDVGDQRHRRLSHDLRQGRGGFLVRHRNAHDLAAEVGELVDLAHGGLGVRRVGAATSTAQRRAHRRRSYMPTRSSPIVICFDSVCARSESSSHLSGQRKSVSPRTMPGDVKVAEHDDEDQHRRHADEVHDRLFLPAQCGGRGERLQSYKSHSSAIEHGQGQNVKDCEIDAEQGREVDKAASSPPGRRPHPWPERCR